MKTYDNNPCAFKLDGLIAAPFTPFHADGELNLAIIPEYAAYLKEIGVNGIFICGTTGEGGSLSIYERQQVLQAWVSAAKGELQIIAHIGHASAKESRELAVHAAETGAEAIAAMPCSRWPISDIDTLVNWIADIAKATLLPFYYYHIPSISGVNLPMRQMLECACDRVPNLSGIKFTYEDLLDFQLCRDACDARYDISFGRDEALLSALALGATSAVGSTYNFAAPLYSRIISAFAEADHGTAVQLQRQSAELIDVMIKHGGLSAIKAAMSYTGLDLGPCRLPMKSLKVKQTSLLLNDLEQRGLLQYIARADNKSGPTAQFIRDAVPLP
ncbi:dihydrodipicolinate synthase family protein [Cerasicoccus maritimus]|uniref:dihydrodipicolinate synthase family protein n=1 Tax=Cerasicoccus maritimus TaxID=490089 RepID=UPI0028528BC8|nr:dihydrodipicolinate synthase family protein [Cerasicoccus maritimus]